MEIDEADPTPALTEIAVHAGELLLDWYGELDGTDAARKEGRRRDLVSRADLEAERAVLDRIPERDSVIAEEGGSRTGDSDRTWYVDPLDGTVNFLHGLPIWAVSLALADRQGLLGAVVHVPTQGWTFSAARGRGARAGSEPIAVSRKEEIQDAILATGFPYARDSVEDHNLDNVPGVGRVAGGLRRMGSAAVDLALVAAGKLDGFWELHLNPWDVAAGILLVREAGGTVTDFRGEEDLEGLLHGRNIVATNGRIQTRLRSLLQPLRAL